MSGRTWVVCRLREWRGLSGRVALFVYRRQREPFGRWIHEHVSSLDVELVRVRGIGEHDELTRAGLERLFAAAPAEMFPWLKRSLLRFQGMPHVARYFHYDAYLAAHSSFTGVLLTDVRDVVFQDDPFLGLDQGLFVGMESPQLTIASGVINRGWMRDAYGDAMLERLGDRQVSCSGVTLGDGVAIRRYVDLMLQEISYFPFSKMKSRSYDQVFHNKLLHCGEMGEVHLCQPLESVIATVACLGPAQLLLSPHGMLLNDDGRIPAIVHQYDRHPALVEAFHSRISAR
ncbi:hypothetical protein OG203_04925 [Nocardia sp. NBC_01499]|uniref:hypothetical protein n=1 Tax=Nocardia sp. NBC_01499 TaxID=2903597 RepID=UPI00386B5118